MPKANKQRNFGDFLYFVHKNKPTELSKFGKTVIKAELSPSAKILELNAKHIDDEDWVVRKYLFPLQSGAKFPTGYDAIHITGGQWDGLSIVRDPSVVKPILKAKLPSVIKTAYQESAKIVNDFEKLSDSERFLKIKSGKIEYESLLDLVGKYKNEQDFIDAVPRKKIIEKLKIENIPNITDEEYLILRDIAIKDFVQNETGRRTFSDNIDWENLNGHTEFGSPLSDKTYKWLDNYLREKPVQNPNDNITMELFYFTPNKPIKLYRGGEINRSVGGVKINSWTHNPEVAYNFAGKNGKIYEAIVEPKDIVFDSKMVDPNYDIPTFSSWEDEVLVRSKIKGEEIMSNIWNKAKSQI